MDMLPPKPKRTTMPVKQPVVEPLLPEVVTAEPDIPATQRSPWPLRIVLALIAIIIMLAALAGGWYVYSTSPVKNGETAKQSITIESGMNVNQIAHVLKVAHLIRSETAFRLYNDVSNTKHKLQAGSYRFSPNQSVAQIVNDLVAGKTDAYNVTVPPGLRLDQIKKILENAGFSSASIDEAFAANYDIPLLATRPSGVNLEGYIFPETYQVDSSTTAKVFVSRTLKQFETVLAGTDIQQKLTAEGLTLHQGITLASLVGKETSNVIDQKQVAQVFLLRLKSNIELGSDTTYQYASHILNVPAATTLESPYNTRIHKGLPPGAIANFNLAALQAVANPASGTYLFFVAGDDGTTHFSYNLAEHETDIQKYCHKLCAQP